MQRPYCQEHPESPAIARCVSCGKYLCRGCVTEVMAKAYCRECGARAVQQGPAGAASSGTAPQVSGQQFSQVSPDQTAPQPSVSQPAAAGGVGATVVASCAFHPGVRAVTRCARCGALLCAGCQRLIGNQRFCAMCYQNTFAPAGGFPARPGARPVRATPSMAAAPWKLWPGLAFLPVPFILSGVMTYMMRSGEEISAGLAQFLLSLLLYSCMLFFAFLTVSRYGSTTVEMGMTGKDLPASIGLGIAGGTVAFWMAVASAFLSFAFFQNLGSVEKWLQGFYDIKAKDVTGVDLLIVGFIIIVVAPICEEIFFRGYLYPPMRKRFGVWGAVFVNGFLFSAVHFSVFGLIGRTLAGAIFCLLYEYNDNLWSPITAHALNNFVAFFLPLVYLSAH